MPILDPKQKGNHVCRCQVLLDMKHGKRSVLNDALQEPKVEGPKRARNAIHQPSDMASADPNEEGNELLS